MRALFLVGSVLGAVGVFVLVEWGVFVLVEWGLSVEWEVVDLGKGKAYFSDWEEEEGFHCLGFWLNA